MRATAGLSLLKYSRLEISGENEKLTSDDSITSEGLQSLPSERSTPCSMI